MIQEGDESIPGIEMAIVVFQVVMRQQHLRNMEVEHREKLPVGRHEPGLSDCGAGLEVGQLSRPFFVIQGKEDMVTPTSVAVKYFNVVKAPKKKLILIEHAGHFALVTHSAEFLSALVKYVRPLAIESGRP